MKVYHICGEICSEINLIRRFLLLLFIICNGKVSNAQALITDFANTRTANQDAILHLESVLNNKGFLLPRVNLISIDQSSPMKNHLKGIVVYNMANSGSLLVRVMPGMYYNDGFKWRRMGFEGVKVVLGDIKHGLQKEDHEGWYLLNGRPLESLSLFAKQNAEKLGFKTSLPNASDRFIKSSSQQLTPGTLKGDQTFKIAKENLPNISFSVTTSTDGDHNHLYGHGKANDKTGVYSNHYSGNSSVFFKGGPDFSSKSPPEVHQHEISFNLGQGEAVSFIPKHMVTNAFIYLGTL